MVNIQKPTSQSEIINLFKRYSKLISTESKLDSAESQRHLYYHILKNIAKTSRKYAVPLLEYFDKQNITYREDNYRKLV